MDFELDMNNIPRHVAIIMDGNGRWAKEQKKPRLYGHNAGGDRLEEILEESINLGVKNLTVYAFSTENWKRPKTEISGLFQLLGKFVDNSLDKLYKNNVKINILGDIESLPKAVRDKVNMAVEKTKYLEEFNFNIALNYGSRDEILRAVNNVVKDVKLGNINKEIIEGEDFEKYLYTRGMDDPDLLIRTSGEIRLSNFLLWQLAYTEFVFTDVYWPAFTKEEYVKSIIEYQNRNRRFGKI